MQIALGGMDLCLPPSIPPLLSLLLASFYAGEEAVCGLSEISNNRHRTPPTPMRFPQGRRDRSRLLLNHLPDPSRKAPSTKSQESPTSQECTLPRGLSVHQPRKASQPGPPVWGQQAHLLSERGKPTQGGQLGLQTCDLCGLLEAQADSLMCQVCFQEKGGNKS